MAAKCRFTETYDFHRALWGEEGRWEISGGVLKANDKSCCTAHDPSGAAHTASYKGTALPRAWCVLTLRSGGKTVTWLSKEEKDRADQ